MSIKADLLAAADLLEERGWCQRTTVDDDGHRCAIGAIRATCSARDVMNRRAGKAVERLMGRVGGDIAGWNDAPERTAEQVVGMLRKAAVR